MGAFKLGKMTFGSLFKKPETVQYPFEKKPQPEGLKGHIVIDVDSCILCGMCDRNCSTNCISVNKSEHYWEINPYQCIQCGYCITVCPKKCLSMNPDYSAAAPEKVVSHFDVPGQQKAAKPDAHGAKAASAPARDKAAETTPARDKTTELKGFEATKDAQLAHLIGNMSPEKAKIVESALNR